MEPSSNMQKASAFQSPLSRKLRESVVLQAAAWAPWTGWFFLRGLPHEELEPMPQKMFGLHQVGQENPFFLETRHHVTSMLRATIMKSQGNSGDRQLGLSIPSCKLGAPCSSVASCFSSWVCQQTDSYGFRRCGPWLKNTTSTTVEGNSKPRAPATCNQ